MFMKVGIFIYFKHFLISISIQNHSNERKLFQVHMESNAVLLTINAWPSSLFHYPCHLGKKKKKRHNMGVVSLILFETY